VAVRHSTGRVLVSKSVSRTLLAWIHIGRLRVKFTDLYPFVDDLEVCHDDRMMYDANHQEPCWCCEQQTHWVEINFQASLCSTECLRIKLDEYIFDSTPRQWWGRRLLCWFGLHKLASDAEHCSVCGRRIR